MLGRAAREITEHVRTLAKLEVELATLEVKRKAVGLGLGAGLGAAAGVLAVFGIVFALATAAAALATVLSVWLALLIVTGVLFLLAGITGVLAAGRFRKKH